ncbi:MAG: DoxX family membrane protein [Chitinophagales bacterium]|nr:DoxX family membrane protein [Bacteroidota bacterium]MBX7141612.1 DoxX family membrane protein [Chitinophagales bacterium]
MNNTLITIGRIILALAMAFFGIGHLTSAQAMSSMIPSFLSSMAVPLVYVTGIFLLLVTVSFIINKWTKWTGILLALFLIMIVLLVHVPGLSNPDAMAAQISMSMMVKDLGIAGAALIVAGLSKS